MCLMFGFYREFKSCLRNGKFFLYCLYLYVYRVLKSMWDMNVNLLNRDLGICVLLVENVFY